MDYNEMRGNARFELLMPNLESLNIDTGVAVDWGSYRGAFSIAIAKRFPGMEVFGIERQPAQAKLHTQRATELGLKNTSGHSLRVTPKTIEGLYRGEDVYDLQIALSIVHHFPMETRKKFEATLGYFLKLANVTYIEMPSAEEGRTRLEHPHWHEWFDGRTEAEVLEDVTNGEGNQQEITLLGETPCYTHPRKLFRVVHYERLESRSQMLRKLIKEGSL